MEAYKLTVKTAEVHIRSKQIGQKLTQRPSREGKSKMQRKRKGSGKKEKEKKILTRARCLLSEWRNMDSLFLKDGKSTDPFEVSSSPCGFPDCSVGKASACNVALLDSWVRKIHWIRDRRPTPVFLGFPCGLAGKESTPMWETWIWSLGWEEGKGYPLQYPGLENSMDCIIHGVSKSQTRLSNFHFHFIPLVTFFP